MIGLFHKLMIYIGVAISIGCYFSATLISNVLFSSQNIEVSYYIKLLTPGIFFAYIVLSYHNNGLMLIGRDDVVQRITVFSSVILFIFGLALVYRLNIVGAVFMIVCGRGVMAASGAYAYRILTSNKRVIE